MRLNVNKTTGSKLFASACAILLCGGLTQQSVGLENASFENPLIGPVDLTGVDFNQPIEILQQIIGFQITETTIPGWVQTGNLRENTGGVISDTGIFSNQPIPQFGVPGIAGVDGLQLAFMVVNTNADKVTLDENDKVQDFVSIFQPTGDTFAEDEDYIFSIEVGNSNSFSGSELTPLIISIGYIDETPGLTGSDVFKAITSEEILLSELDTSGSELLRDFTVELLAEDLNATFLGRAIAIQALIAVPDDLTFEEKTNIQGAYNVDNARFVVVPEPTSLAMLAAGGLLFLRRRR